jgi:hypothetical protein
VWNRPRWLGIVGELVLDQFDVWLIDHGPLENVAKHLRHLEEDDANCVRHTARDFTKVAKGVKSAERFKCDSGGYSETG